MTVNSSNSDPTHKIEEVDHVDSLVDKAYAVVLGEALTATDLPEDLYIPPEALRVFLETFTGPLDLLLYLIKKQNIDILDIPVAKITTQYVEYLELMHEMQLELAAEYLVMAAILAEIKSKLLLPHFASPEATTNEDDPRAELVRRLQEYERYKSAATKLDQLPRLERDLFTISADIPEIKNEPILPQIELQELLWAFKDVLQRAATYSHHKIRLENLSVRERMTQILDKLQSSSGKTLSFIDLLVVQEGKLGVVVSLMALLELLRQEVIMVVQDKSFGGIYLQSVTL